MPRRSKTKAPDSRIRIAVFALGIFVSSTSFNNSSMRVLFLPWACRGDSEHIQPVDARALLLSIAPGPAGDHRIVHGNLFPLQFPCNCAEAGCSGGHVLSVPFRQEKYHRNLRPDILRSPPNLSVESDSMFHFRTRSKSLQRAFGQKDFDHSSLALEHEFLETLTLCAVRRTPLEVAMFCHRLSVVRHASGRSSP
jgi:hypothetical protein